jgi:hypothetical protein
MEAFTIVHTPLHLKGQMITQPNYTAYGILAFSMASTDMQN